MMADELPEFQKVHIRGADCYALYTVPTAEMTEEVIDEVIRRAKVAYPAQQSRLEELEGKNKRLKSVIFTIKRNVKAGAVTTQWINNFISDFIAAHALKEKD